MHTIERAMLSVLGCSLFILVSHCGNPLTASATTSTELAASGPQTPVAAVAGSAASEPVEANEAAVSSAAREVEAAPASEPRREARSASRGHRRPVAPASRGGLGVRRLVVAEGVEAREPVDAAERFDVDHERLFAFVEASNRGGDATHVVVSFENEDGVEVGDIRLDIPANVPRWRTWAWTRHARTPGVWHAVVRSADGEELSRRRFEIEG